MTVIAFPSRRVLEERGGGRRVDRQGQLGELWQIVEVVRGYRSPRDPVDAQHPLPTWDHWVACALDVTDETLVAAQPLGELSLGPSLTDAPFRQPHETRPEPEQRRYVALSYLVNGHCNHANAEYDAMAYCVLVMRPGNRLREMRQRAGLSQAELAERYGADQGTISNWENSKRPLSIEKMRGLARVLGCTVADLLGDEDNPDRLDDTERALIEQYREADEQQREMIARVAAPVTPYRPQRSADKAA